MQFILTGFTQDLGCRVFAFEGIALDRIRTAFTVRADLALIRRYGIQIQELPLLCRTLLERRDEASEAQALTFTEEEMRTCATARAAAKDEAARAWEPLGEVPNRSVIVRRPRRHWYAVLAAFFAPATSSSFDGVRHIFPPNHDNWMSAGANLGIRMIAPARCNGVTYKDAPAGEMVSASL
jgi:hypothetical protein